MTSVVKGTCVVDSDDGRCSAVGREILKRGGNAVDAAVAVTLCLGVTNIGSSGIGGGAFMLVRMANGTVQGFDMRETCPSRISESMYNGSDDIKFSGPLSIAVPGEVKGLYEAWKMFGSLPWSELVEPAAKFAEAHTVSPYLHAQMQHVQNVQYNILTDPGLRRVYTSDGKNLLKPGDVCRNRELADTLRAIGRNGDDLYTGETAKKLARDLVRFGSPITEQDLMNYQVKKVNPIKTQVMGHDFITMPPPASGGAGMVLILNILDQYKYGGLGKKEDDKIWYHRFIEAVKHMLAVRTHLGDPAFDKDVKHVVHDMLSKEFAGELKAEISDHHTQPDPYCYGGKWHIVDKSAIVEDYGTSHLSIVDEQRNAVALTSSVNWYFGSRYMSPSTGILLNNQMDDFTLPNANLPYPANRIVPNKRPLSSMAPTILLKGGKLKVVVGSSGGFRITAGTAQVLLNYLARNMDVLPAIMHPRIFGKLEDPYGVEYEDWTSAKGYRFEVPKETREHLKRKGHELKSVRENNMCQFLVVSDDMKYVTGASDPRKGSYPAGYISERA